MRKETSIIPVSQKIVYVSAFWALILVSILVFFFISRIGVFLVLLIAQIIYTFKIKKYELYVFPRVWIDRLNSNRFYNKFYRVPCTNKTWSIVSNIALFMVFLSGLVYQVSLVDGPIIYLEDMTLTQGVLEGCRKLTSTRKSYSCGDYQLTVRKNNGEKAMFYESTLSRRDLQIGKNVTLWTQSFSYWAPPHCKKYPQVWQFEGPGLYIDRYDMDKRKRNDNVLKHISFVFLGIAIFLIVLLVSSPPKESG
ncbi:MAG: hypothetical protein ACI8ZB_003313 [Desulforhopalus sp.]|jgi:hypothetical protein